MPVLIAIIVLGAIAGASYLALSNGSQTDNPALVQANFADAAPPSSDGGDGGDGWKSCTLTCYYPHLSTEDPSASAADMAIEGGEHDRKGQQLYTVQDWLAGKGAYVSISGDDALFPYGTTIQIEYLNEQYGNGATVPCRVVDTGSHFRGIGKVFRFVGSEPLDVAMNKGGGFGIVRSRYKVE